MNPSAVEFALRKQRLQFRAEQQRTAIVGHIRRVESMLDVVDRARDGVHELRHHTPLLSAAALLLLVLKPRLALRVGRRAWVGWMVDRKLRPHLEPVRGFLRRFSA